MTDGGYFYAMCDYYPAQRHQSKAAASDRPDTKGNLKLVSILRVTAGVYGTQLWPRNAI
jgi:hypothetical protein